MAGRLATVVAFFKINLKNTFVYRGMLILWLVGWLLSFMTMYYLWRSSAIAGQVGDYSLNQLTTYYFIGTLVVAICGWYPFYFMVNIIKNGSIIIFMTKPIHFFSYNIGAEIGWHTANTVLYLGLFLLIYLLVRTQIVFNLAGWNWFWFSLSLAIAALVSMEVNLILATVAFWLTEAEGLGSLYWMALTLLGGQVIPLSFFPGFWRGVVAVLPFRFMYSYPLEIYLGKVNPPGLIISTLTGMLWVAGLYFLFKYLWGKGLKAYTSFGQ